MMAADVGKLLSDYTAQHPRRQSSSYSPSKEPEISPAKDTFCEEEALADVRMSLYS
jgi:hypothetical protein